MDVDPKAMFKLEISGYPLEKYDYDAYLDPNN